MKFISSLMLSLCSVLGFSQTILYQPETASRTVQDPQAVVMAQGFHATGNVSNSFLAKIGPATENPGGGPTDSQAGANNPSGANTPNFHNTKGNIEVNGVGQLQFTLPIDTPPGVKSVAPQVNLAYTSGSGNGIAGFGWSIAGISTISRSGKNIEQDGESKNIQLDYSDYYSFNGQRLILKSGEYGKEGAEYTTEKYSNIKIKSFGVNASGPAYWEVTFEDGSQAKYEKTFSDGGFRGGGYIPALEYNITKWKDAQGNFITYNYESNWSSTGSGGFRESKGGISRISTINWGGNETLNKPHLNSIAFTYVDREFVEQSYIQNLTMVQDKILSEIKVNSNSKLYKTYNITYTKDDNGLGYQFLSSITESNSAGDQANSVNFNYEKSKLGGWKSTQYDSTEDHKVLGDFDGDGKVDMLKYSNTVNYCKRYNSEAPLSPRADENEISYTDYSDSKCMEWVYESGGFYLFRNIFDDNKPEKIYVSADISKESLDNASAIVVKDNNNIVNSKQSLVIFKKNPINGSQKADLEFKVYIFSDNNTLDYQFSKTIQYSQYAADQNTVVENQLKEVDLNGDGLSELIVTVKDAAGLYKYLRLNLDKDIANNSSFASFDLLPKNSPAMSNYMTGDFDGDSKTDFLRINNNVPTFVKLQDNGQNITVIETPIFSNSLNNPPSITGIWDRAVLGDYNGDGKTDFLIPAAFGSSDWRMYTSTGVGFVEKYYSNFCYFAGDENDPDNYIPWYSYKRSYVAQDLNKDGKSDFIEFYSLVQIGQKGAQSRFLINLYENTGYKAASSKVEFQKKKLVNYRISETKLPPNSTRGLIENRRGFPYKYNTDRAWYDPLVENFTWSTVADHYNPIFGNFRINMSDENILVFQKNRLYKFNYYDVSKDARIKSITQGNVTTEIEYKELNSNVDPNIYQTVKKEKFPYLELNKVYQTTAVSQLRYAGRKQDFRYRGFVSHLLGKGVIGFRQSARSSWYADGFENTKVWSGIEMDPLNDAAITKEWSIRTNDEAKVFPADLSENNTQLLSFKSTIYNTDKLLNGQILTSLNNIDKSKVVTAVIPTSTKAKDFLTNTVTTSNITYGEYYLPSQSISKLNDGFATTISNFEYIHNPAGNGSDYYIGRPKVKTSTIQAYGDTKTSKEEYLYDNNLLKTLKKWNRDNTEYLQESYNYDGFGNTIEKTIANSTDSKTQTNKAQYESTGRFIEKQTDNLGLETHFTYNDQGQVLTETDPIGNKIINTYDEWDKIMKSKSNLQGTTTYTYTTLFRNGMLGFRDPVGTETAEYSPDGGVKVVYTNLLGQQYKTATKAFGQGQYVSKEVQYDVLGRKTGESEPSYVGPKPEKWNKIIYDDSVFPPKVTAISFSGLETVNTSSGLSTTIEETKGNKRVTTKTMDALGNVISTTDKGGTIKFSYNAAGDQIKAQYAENIVTTQYDSWGRKIEFNDPSNGVYKYEYDGFGQIKKTISPKGTKEYTYNNLGQLISQKEISTADGGKATNKLISFAYDNKGRITSKSGTSKGKAYGSTITYDPQGRVISTSENSNDKYFIKKGITYDDKARVISYEKQLYSSGTLTKVVVENAYNEWNGDLYQVKDKNSGKILSEIKETNLRGQILKAKLGAVNITNLYDDSNGFLTSINHSSQVKQDLLQVTYSFDAIKNELRSRRTGGDFNITEVFEYDNNNRLVKWTNPVTGQYNSNIYDVKGRILENDQVGKIKFENSAKVYQPTGMTLNAAGTQNYNNDLIQNISYNENNDPIFIDGEKGDVAFQYGLTAMRQKVSFGGNFDPEQEGKFTRFYSEDGSFEVTKDNITGKEKHTIYIGGTPYESNIVYLKNYDEANASYRFLHKDYLGSILAISDEAGNKLEQRHFDAWGNFTHLQIGNGPILTDKNSIDNASLLVDRGYTGHEHFAEVGIIHMNGRLYDPLLRRFLNADENIQDPYNTQNYNKYGYVLNNPLMFNDPNGELFQFAFLAVMGAFWGTVMTGAIISSAIATFLYLAKAYLTKSFSVSGFFKAVTIGSITGAVSAGLGQVFSAGSLIASIGNGVLSGAGASAVQALASGTNFLKGITQGAVIGGAMGAISWGIGKLFSNNNSQDVLQANAEGKFSYDGQKFNSQEELIEYINKNNGNVEVIMKKLKISKIELVSETNLPSAGDDKHILKLKNGLMTEYQTDAMGSSIDNTGRTIFAKTVKSGDYSALYVSPGLKGIHVNGHYLAKTIINHEFIHSYHYMKGLSFETYLERSAWSYNYSYARFHGLNVDSFIKNLSRFGGFNIPNAYKWSTAGLEKFIKLY
ncbi:hypothetical protein C1637_04045 [Chryseobacterium lactis]|uniref:Teneurin-like YD-shell domain-containing protein n=1 Tax=Chryseobacterium lactis TaxID=1241981 RepID=A0A3G6RSK9_CHRLC|nr:RHS repeat-associated core domain-containing protein [Chryseobacterium lactis]AZA81755.1 hypothetical protein EG342_07440 [Chryseobacterium lactis]AZB06753.1 hypothetical protein EG341_23560 [Chryseobacterium lactis]PNW15604.1 hypothetical protein C1637_04045 [Chryseobacterium lactis]